MSRIRMMGSLGSLSLNLLLLLPLCLKKKKDVIRSYGFGSLLLFDKCFVPKKFSKWLTSHVECKSGDLLIRGKVISLTAKTVNLVIGIPVGGTPFPSKYSNGRSIFV
jgi:hypothetical protein